MLLLSGDGWSVIEVLLAKALMRMLDSVLVLELGIGIVSCRLPPSSLCWPVARCLARLSPGCVSDRFLDRAEVAP